MKNVLLSSLFFISIALSQKADFNFNRIYYGNEVSSLTARSLGLGGAGLSGGDAFMALTHKQRFSYL